MKKWKTLSSEVINKNPWTEFRHDRFEMPSGYQGDYFYLQTPGGSVTIVPILPDGRIVLHREYRYLFERESLEFPSGGVKAGQTPEQAAAAELEEETGYAGGSFEMLSKTAPTNGLLREYMHTFVATGLTEGVARPDETEDFEVVTMTVDEVDAAIASGEIWDGFCVTAWYFARPRVLEIIQGMGND